MTAKPSATPCADQDLNDIGNAECFVNTFWGVMAYVPELGAWRRWTGKRWLDDNDEAMRDAQIVARAWFETLMREPDPGRQKRILAHAQRTSSVDRLHAMLAIARTRGLTVPAREWDADPLLLGVQNGVVDLRTGESVAPDPRLRISKCVGAEFDRDAEAPTWSAFLDRVMDGDVGMISFLQRAVGYSLSGDTREQCVFLLHGAGANGKSTFLQAARELLGDYGRSCPAETLLARDDARIPNDLARLAGARLVTAVETGDGKRLAEAMLKALTGGDTVTARFLHREFFEFVPAFKLWLATNHKPTIRDDGLALWRRIRLVPFNVTIPDLERDGGLPAKLAAERSGILNWAIEGARAWQRDGLQTPEPVRAATAAYREESDRLGQWITERCVTTPAAEVQARAGFTDYRHWSDARGERAMTETAFGRKLVERGFQRVKRSRANCYAGLGLEDVEGLQLTSHSFLSAPAREEKRGNGLQTLHRPSTDLPRRPDERPPGGDRDADDYERASRGE